MKYSLENLPSRFIMKERNSKRIWKIILGTAPHSQFPDTWEELRERQIGEFCMLDSLPDLNKGRLIIVKPYKEILKELL